MNRRIPGYSPVRILFAAFWLFPFAPLQAEALHSRCNGESSSFTGFQFENDSINPYWDNSYSHGFDLYYGSCQADPYLSLRLAKAFFPQYFRDQTAEGSKEKANRPPTLISGIHAGNMIYNPYSMGRKDPEFGEVPYGSFLYLGDFFRMESGTSTFWLSTEVGVFGPDAGGKEAQTAWHGMTIQLVPLGWDHQIPNSFAFRVHGSYEEEVFRLEDLSLSATVPYSIGNVYTYAGAGATARYRLFGNSSIVAAIDGRYLAYHGFLEGGNPSDTMTVRRVESEEFASYRYMSDATGSHRTRDESYFNYRQLFWNYREKSVIFTYRLFHWNFYEKKDVSLLEEILVFHSLFSGGIPRGDYTKNAILFLALQNPSLLQDPSVLALTYDAVQRDEDQSIPLWVKLTAYRLFVGENNFHTLESMYHFYRLFYQGRYSDEKAYTVAKIPFWVQMQIGYEWYYGPLTAHVSMFFRNREYETTIPGSKNYHGWIRVAASIRY